MEGFEELHCNVCHGEGDGSCGHDWMLLFGHEFGSHRGFSREKNDTGGCWNEDGHR